MFTQKNHHQIRIVILGQCIASGVGVGENAAYPRLVERMLKTQFPATVFHTSVYPFIHPTGLLPLLKSVLSARPDIILLSVPATFASSTWRGNALYLQAPDVMMMARAFLRKIEPGLKRNLRLWRLYERKSLLLPTSVCPAVTAEEYERLLTEAISYSQQQSSARLVLLGPGGFNEYVSANDGTISTPELGTTINQMVLRVGQRMKLPVINAYDFMADQRTEVYLPENHRWGLEGHQVMSREICAVFASEVRNLTATSSLH